MSNEQTEHVKTAGQSPPAANDVKAPTPGVSTPIVDLEKRFKTLAAGLNEQIADEFKKLNEKKEATKTVEKVDIWKLMRKRALDSNFVSELSKTVKISNERL